MKYRINYSNKNINENKIINAYYCIDLIDKKCEAIKTATDLCYPDGVKSAILRAKNENEITRALITARHMCMCC